MAPKKVYNEMIDKSDDIAPMDIKQVQNKKYYQRRKERESQNKTVNYRSNFSDNVQVVENLVHKHPFVQQVIHTKDKVPTVSNMLDLERYCVKQGQIIGFDKTFNLSKDIHLTVSAFKQKSFLRNSTQDHPIFLGSMMLHGSSTTESYASFFCHLASKLNASDSDCMVFGTDNEMSMRNAIKQAFPNATQILCMRHLIQNTENKLADKCGLEKKARREIINQLFGKDGLANADDSISFEVRSEEIQNHVLENVPDFIHYLNNKVLPMIKHHVNKPQREKAVEESWTNNNCESANHMLKLEVDWKPQPLVELVERFYSLIRAQYKDLQRATIGAGNFKLAGPFKHHYINPSVWASKSNSEKNQLFLRFLKDSKSGYNSKYITCTDGSRIVPTPNGGEKPGQRKRKRNAKTTTDSRKKARNNDGHN